MDVPIIIMHNYACIILNPLACIIIIMHVRGVCLCTQQQLHHYVVQEHEYNSILLDNVVVYLLIHVSKETW